MLSPPTATDDNRSVTLNDEKVSSPPSRDEQKSSTPSLNEKETATEQENQLPVEYYNQKEENAHVGHELKQIQTSESGVVYPSGLRLNLISLALCLSVFLMALVG